MKNFSDIDWVIDRATGERLPFEETISTKQNVFFDNGISTPSDDGEKLLLRLAMNRLTDQQRKVIQGIYFDGKTQKEVAEYLNIWPSAVGKHHDRALKKLRKVCLHD